MLTALLNDIAALASEFVLVLDDYHMVDAAPIDYALTFLLEHLPSQMHLVITCPSLIRRSRDCTGSGSHCLNRASQKGIKPVATKRLAKTPPGARGLFCRGVIIIPASQLGSGSQDDGRFTPRN